jgi:hypothetical protein
MSDIKYYGIFPQITDGKKTTTDFIQNKNGKPVFQDYCGAHTDLVSKDVGVNYNCTDYLDTTGLKTAFNADCRGKDTCSLDMMKYAPYKNAAADVPAVCKDKLSMVYVQFKCNIPADK